MNDWINDLKKVLPNGQFSKSRKDLLNHSCDSWSVSIKQKHQGKTELSPDLVFYPQSDQEISKILVWAKKSRIPVTPWGFGSSVTGAPLPLSGGVSLDMSHMDKIINLDQNNLHVTVEAGICGKELENYLNSKKLTLNHSPQSLHRSTPGGWFATRATGQFSSRYGGIENLILGINVVIPNGEIIKIKPAIRASMGPDLKEVFLGAEGAMGVVTQLTLKIFPFPEKQIFESICFDSVLTGIHTMQKIMQAGLRPFLMRFYDEDESIYVTKNENFTGSIMFLGFEGRGMVTKAEYETALEFCRDAGGLVLGPELAHNWMSRRFDYSTIDNIISKPGGLAETLEVAHFWTDIYSTYQELKKTLVEYVDEVFGHFSHAYPQGTSLYMILLNKKESDKGPEVAEEKLRKIWNVVHEVTSRTGAMAAHHHGVGIARLPIIEKELGNGLVILQQIKKAMDPSNILCPGKLGLSKFS